jgi:lysyl oxidase
VKRHTELRPRSATAVGRCMAYAASLAACSALVAAATPAAAFIDLELDGPRIARSAMIDTGVFHPPHSGPALDAIAPISGSCVLDPDEMCVGGPGIRKLLRFDVQVHNIGTEDLVIGNPADHLDLFVFSACHHHYHFKQAALYELLDETGTQVRRGRKQGFCMEDTAPSTKPAPSPPKYNCQYQGIQVGWSDLYPFFLDCQWIDITDVEPGNYQLHVVWNPAHLLPETTLDNDSATVPIVIPAPADAPPRVDSIRAPNRYSHWQAGHQVEIAWHASDDQGVVTQEVWFSADDGATYRQLVGDVPSKQSRFLWTIPLDAATDHARIKVVARDASVQPGELVSAPFTIARAIIHLPRLAR